MVQAAASPHALDSLALPLLDELVLGLGDWLGVEDGDDAAMPDWADQLFNAAPMSLDTLDTDVESWTGSAGAEPRAESATAVLGSSPLRQELPPAQRLHLHRCLDCSHRQPCPMCTVAPGEGEEADFELVGESGKKNGEKRLRSLVCKTAEWNSGEERNRLATLCEARAAGGAHLREPSGSATSWLPKLAQALRTKRSANLGKSHLLFISRAWGYSSDIWWRHGRASRAKAAKEEAHDAAPGQPGDTPAAVATQLGAPPSALELRLHGGGFAWGASLLDVRTLSATAAQQEADRQLRPLALAATALFAGRDARQAATGLALADLHALLSSNDVEEAQAGALRLRGFNDGWRSLRDATAAELDGEQRAAPPAGAAPAWRVLSGRDTHLERQLRAFSGGLRRVAVANCPVAFFHAPEVLDALRSGAIERPDQFSLSCPGPDQCTGQGMPELLGAGAPPLQAAQACYLTEMFRALCAAVELATRLQALVCDSKFAAHTEYLAINLHVIDVMTLFTASASDAFAERALWMQQLLSAAKAPAAPDTPQRRLLFKMDCGESAGDPCVHSLHHAALQC